ncbi:hypothetical protein [Acetobacter ascendens]|uniref:Uncharacterized protein n=1 Tax=Acetobacter ascendens TaxID=481146 RepID=A0A1Y0V1V6_9PROT|nr:hypothetical protein [Acetobacter ascendens]ARW12132.1 hypothetical protein S101447_03095 [Acetobacter ascendens]
MLEIIVDSSLFCIPTIAASEVESEKIFFNIQEISEWMSSDYPVLFTACHKFHEYLSCSFPDFQSIEEFLYISNLREIYSPNDLFSTFLSVIDKIKIAEYDEVNYPIIDENSCVDVDINWLSPEILRNSFLESASLCHNNESPSVLLFYSDQFSEKNINIKYNKKSEFDEMCCIEGSIYIIKSLGDVFTNKFSELVWRKSSNSSGIYSAIWLGIGEYFVTSSEDPLKNFMNFSVGSDFFASLTLHQCAGNGRFHDRTLRSCVAYFTNPTSIKKRIFTGVSLRARDSAKAFRSHITKGNPALRLLTWETPENRVEFANVGNKKELIILNGDANGIYP